MFISTKGRYALRMLLDLAEHQNDGYVALKDIADRQDIFKNRDELIGSHTLFQTVKYKADSACCTTVHEKSKEQFFLCKKHGQQGLL